MVPAAERQAKTLDPLIGCSAHPLPECQSAAHCSACSAAGLLLLSPLLTVVCSAAQLRGVLDPKLHFKRVDDNKALRKYFQVGIVINPAHDYFSRLTKKERKPTLADEVLADTKLRDYRLRKVRQVNESRQPGGVGKWKIKGLATWKRAKERRKEARR